jgi:hypothetical protein
VSGTSDLSQGTHWYWRLSNLPYRRPHAHRPVHIVQPAGNQPYGANWLMYCGLVIHHAKGVTVSGWTASREWERIPFCIPCSKKAPSECLYSVKGR